MGTQHAVNYEEVDDETTVMAFEVRRTGPRCSWGALLPTHRPLMPVCACDAPPLFQELGLPSWLAEGNVETLRYFREGG